MRKPARSSLLLGLLSLGAASFGLPAQETVAPPPQQPPGEAVRVEALAVPETDAPATAGPSATGAAGDAAGTPAVDPAAEPAPTASADEFSAPPADVAARTPTDWLEATVAIQDYVDAGDLEAALALRERLLELAAEQFGAESAGVAEAHLMIADLYRRGGAYQQATDETLFAIDAYVMASGPVSPDLIDPYLVLGDTYVEGGDYQSGISAYREARTIGRRNFGLLNPDQLDIIDRMTDAAERLGQAAEAQQLQLEALTLVERSFTEFSIEAIEARYKYAYWLRRHGLFEDERRIYYEIERVIREEYDDDPVMNVRLLRERAQSFRVADSGDGVGLGALVDALDIIEDMAEPPPLLHAEVLVDIGDWYIEFARTRPFGEEYLQAWALLGEVDGGEELRKAWFDSLVEIEMASLSRRDLTTDPDAPQGHVVVYFTIDTAGRTQNIEITDSEPPGFKDGAVDRLIREARFRPRIVGGQLVPARRAYRFEFRYIPPEQQ